MCISQWTVRSRQPYLFLFPGGKKESNTARLQVSVETRSLRANTRLYIVHPRKYMKVLLTVFQQLFVCVFWPFETASSDCFAFVVNLCVSVIETTTAWLLRRTNGQWQGRRNLFGKNQLFWRKGTLECIDVGCRLQVRPGLFVKGTNLQFSMNSVWIWQLCLEPFWKTATVSWT